MQTFDPFELSPGTRDAVASMGYETPTPVQVQAIPLLLARRDVIVQARTGTGKTAAFGIPLVEHSRALEGRDIVALVLVPTRELAIQVSAELAEIAKGSGVRVVTVYGGVGFGGQNSALKHRGIRILVATPGRLLDHMGRGTADLGGVRFLVLDEADRMLDMGFLPDVERILAALPRERQTGLFSATVPEPIRRLAHRFLHDAATVRVESGAAATPHAEQFRIAVEKPEKTAALLALLAQEAPERAIVFTRTKHLARRLAGNLARAGHRAVALQGNMSQPQRERAMLSFREGEARILVATDIASRGLDIPEVSHVVNFDLPDEPEAYVHRIGRTGRMGRAGRAFTFVQSDQHRDLAVVEGLAGSRMASFDVGPLPEMPRVVHGVEPMGGGRAHFSGRQDGGRGHSRHGAGPRGPSHAGGHPQGGSRDGRGGGGTGRGQGGRGGSGSRGGGGNGGGGGRSGGPRGARHGARGRYDDRRREAAGASSNDGQSGGPREQGGYGQRHGREAGEPAAGQNHIRQPPPGRGRRREPWNRDSGLY